MEVASSYRHILVSDNGIFVNRKPYFHRELLINRPVIDAYIEDEVSRLNVFVGVRGIVGCIFQIAIHPCITLYNYRYVIVTITASYLPGHGNIITMLWLRGADGRRNYNGARIRILGSRLLGAILHDFLYRLRGDGLASLFAPGLLTVR